MKKVIEPILASSSTLIYSTNYSNVIFFYSIIYKLLFNYSIVLPRTIFAFHQGHEVRLNLKSSIKKLKNEIKMKTPLFFCYNCCWLLLSLFVSVVVIGLLLLILLLLLAVVFAVFCCRCLLSVVLFLLLSLFFSWWTSNEHAPDVKMFSILLCTVQPLFLGESYVHCIKLIKC